MFSLYAHIPYCRTICPYCDFNVHPARRMPEDAYVEALVGELEHAARRPPWSGAAVQSIYLGGGTPSLFAAASIERLLSAVRGAFPIEAPAEITLEANPGTVDREKLEALRAAGVTRLSLGAQSLSARSLEQLGRDHSPEEVPEALGAARQAGFGDVNLDLIFAVPGQTPADWECDLEAACALSPDHVSAYNLTFEEGTAFYARRSRGALHAVGEEAEEEMFRRAQARLAAAGYEHYEISNYARPGHRSRHNSNYWRGGEYLGIGAGAHSFARRGWGERWANERDPRRYMAAIAAGGAATAFSEVLSERQAMGEHAFLGLRQRDGVDDAAFVARFGAAFADRFPQVAGLCEAGLLERAPGGWRLTPRGLMLADGVFAEFV